MKRCSPSGGRPATTWTNQLAIAATNAAMPHRPSQTKCGIASSSRKKTVGATALASSVDVEAHRVVFARRPRRARRAGRARIAVGDQQEIPVQLGVVGDPVGARVAEAARHAAAREDSEPAEQRDHRQHPAELAVESAEFAADQKPSQRSPAAARGSRARAGSSTVQRFCGAGLRHLDVDRVARVPAEAGYGSASTRRTRRRATP